MLSLKPKTDLEIGKILKLLSQHGQKENTIPLQKKQHLLKNFRKTLLTNASAGKQYSTLGE